MRWISAVAAALVLAACVETAPVWRVPTSGGSGGSAGGSSGASAGGPAVAASGPAAVQEMAQLVNEHRRARGCGALVWLQPAADAAQGHSADMARRNYFDHVSPEGQRPWDRLVARGVSYRSMAENIAWTPEQSARQTLQGWIESAGHRQNLENCAYTHHGIGLQSAYWTHVFVTPAPAPRQ
jgi:uncharacterized protein YkwD